MKCNWNFMQRWTLLFKEKQISPCYCHPEGESKQPSVASSMSYVVSGAWNLSISAELPSGRPQQRSAQLRSLRLRNWSIKCNFQQVWFGESGDTGGIKRQLEEMTEGIRGVCFQSADDKASLRHVTAPLFSIQWRSLLSIRGLIRASGPALTHSPWNG